MFPMNQEIEKLSVECANLLGLEIAGVDILFDGDSYMVAEVNSSPGFEGFESATGINVAEKVYDYVAEKLG